MNGEKDSAPAVVEVGIAPAPEVDAAQVAAAIARYAEDTGGIECVYDATFGRIALRAGRERDLDLFVALLRAELDCPFRAGATQVIYRERLAQRVDIDHCHKKQSGGSGEFARVKVTLVPGEPGSGVQFFDQVPDGNVPADYIPSVETGMREMADCGHLIGFPIVDFEFHLTDGAWHDIDSSPLAFEIAGRGAMREGAEKAGIKILEPIMKLAVLAPRYLVAAVRKDLVERRGTIHESETGVEDMTVALVPTAMLFGYDRDLAVLSHGQADVAMVFDHYADVPSECIDPLDSFAAALAIGG
jgi:elongation factor G